MNPPDITTLLNMTESESFDFKSDQYKFYGATEEEKAELLKDIVAFANAWKTGDAFVVIGVLEKNGRKDKVVGVTTPLKDNDVQQFVNSKTNRPVRFLVYSDKAEGQDINVILIARVQPRPIFLSKAFGKLKPNDTLIRSGSSTAIASPDQIADMAKADQNAILGETRIAIEWADATTRTRLGSEVTLTGIRLIDPPPPPPRPKPRPPTTLEKKIAGLSPFDHFQSLQRQVVRPISISMNDGPTAEELKEFAQTRALFRPLRIWLKNLGARNASSVKVRIMIPKLNGVVVVDRGNLPKKPEGRFAALFSPSHLLIDTTVEEWPDGWCAETDAKTIQPQDEFWSCDSFYVSSASSQTIEAIATIYADDLSKPIEIHLRIHTEVVEREITPRDLGLKQASEKEGSED